MSENRSNKPKANPLCSGRGNCASVFNLDVTGPAPLTIVVRCLQNNGAENLTVYFKGNFSLRQVLNTYE